MNRMSWSCIILYISIWVNGGMDVGRMHDDAHAANDHYRFYCNWSIS